MHWRSRDLGKYRMMKTAANEALRLARRNGGQHSPNAGAQNWAMLASLIETCKLSAVEPYAYISGILTAIANGHKQNNIDALLSLDFKAQTPTGS